MSAQVLRDLIQDIGNNYFSIICDEYTDISNKEQLTLCLRWVDNDIKAYEEFLGFYQNPDISANTLKSVIKDSLLCLSLSLERCRQQHVRQKIWSCKTNARYRTKGIPNTLPCSLLKPTCQGYSKGLQNSF